MDRRTQSDSQLVAALGFLSSRFFDGCVRFRSQF